MFESNLNNYKVNHPKRQNGVDAADLRLDGQNCKIPRVIDLEPYCSVQRDFISNTADKNFRIEEFNDQLKKNLNLKKRV